jgi:tetratricopeptide (TPR) repeat protein
MTHIFGSVSMSDQVIYTVGGTVQASGGTYISRDADEELLRLCRAGEFCYVLTPRQMGKSSLMVATMERLAAEGFRSVEIDLTEMGTELSGLTAEQWYLGLIELIVDQLDLDVDYVAWWDERAHLGPTQRLSQFLRQVVLEQVSEPVVIFIDEVDSTLSLGFTDDFFAAIRACYNARARDPVFKRVSFVLLGVATPGDLISDPQRTPFNIGRWMDLSDFTHREASPLATGFDLPPVEADQVLTWILDWTGGHPYLTQRLCAAAAASPTKNWDAVAVDKLVEETFFGEQSAQDSNLRFVRDMLIQRAPDKAAVLKTYRRIHADKAVLDEERSLVKTHLKLSGIVSAEDGYLHIRNEIYRRVFDLAWVRENTPRNWAPIAVGTALLIALLAVGFVIHNVWVANRVDASTLKFYQTTAPEERVARLADIFEPPCLFQVTDYDYQARELFYGLSREEQLALFGVDNVEDSDLIVVMKGLYVTLADTDGTDSTRPLLEAMAAALGDLNATEETERLEGEINSWLEGRKSAKRNQYTDALVEYNNAIVLNGDNPATLYERARVLIELSEYQKALDDLDQVIAIARRSPAPTPAASSTTTPTVSSPTSTLTPTSIPTPSADMTPNASPSVSVTPISASSLVATPTPSAITSEFATIGEMISAVRNIIYSNPDLVSRLAGASSSEYLNLREFGLVPTPMPTPLPTQELTLESYPAPTQVSPVFGAEIMREDVVEFSWHWDSILQEREWFDLRIWRLGKPVISFSIQRVGSYLLDTPPDGFGQYQWQVAVVRIDENGGKSTLCESPIWPFIWSDVQSTSISTVTSTPTAIPDAVVNAEALNLRSGPGMVYDILGVLKRGDCLEITCRSPEGDWLEVGCPDGEEGWVARWLLKVNVDMASVPVCQVSPTPTLMYTPTPAVTLTPTPLPPPILLEPENGASFIGEPVILRWRWDRPLAQDENFSLRVYKEGELEVCHHTLVHALEYTGDLSYCSEGTLYWSVALVRELCKDCPEEGRWQLASEPSAERWIYYTPGEELWEPPMNGETINIQGKVCAIKVDQDTATIFLRQAEFDAFGVPAGTTVSVTVLDTGKTVEKVTLGLDSSLTICSVRLAKSLREALGVAEDTYIELLESRPDRQISIRATR